MSNQDLFVTDIDRILEVLDQAMRALLYDTVAVSSHKLAYHRTQDRLVSRFAGPGDILMMTETVQRELEEGDATGLYRDYLQPFAPILVVKESDLIRILEQDYHPQHARAKLKETCLAAFATIQPLHKAMQEFDTHRFEARALDAYEGTFASIGNANKGEYSLLWLSLVLRKRVGQALDIRFLGMDNDLFEIVERCYYNPDQVLGERKAAGKVEVASTESLLQGFYRMSGSDDELVTDVDKFRIDLQRRIWYREAHDGILSRIFTRSSLSNEAFVELVSHQKIDVVY